MPIAANSRPRRRTFDTSAVVLGGNEIEELLGGVIRKSACEAGTDEAALETEDGAWTDCEEGTVVAAEG